MGIREKLREGYLTLLEAAEFVGVTDRTIKRLAFEGRLKRYRQLGRREVLYSREELERVLAPRPASA